jgi:signal recognition particle receptor subunit alpha
MRTWDESVTIDSEEAASLDYSAHKDAGDTNAPDLSQLVDERSRGARGDSGMYALKDVDMGVRGVGEGQGEEDDIIAQAINKTSIGQAADSPATADPSQPAKSRFGTLASLFSRITGSSRTLTKEELEPVLTGMQEHLMQKNVAQEIAAKICGSIGESLEGKQVSGYRGEWISLYSTSLPSTSLLLYPRNQDWGAQCAF